MLYKSNATIILDLIGFLGALRKCSKSAENALANAQIRYLSILATLLSVSVCIRVVCVCLCNKVNWYLSFAALYVFRYILINVMRHHCVVICILSKEPI